jgi:sugar (pentulose or hexulose) kinase
MARWAGAADLVAYLLTGRLVTDHTLAGRTMAYRLPEAGTETEAGTGAGSGAPPPESFDADLLAEVGLTPAMLPDVVCAGIAGTATSVLPAGTAVVVAGHDHAVGAYAAGVRRAGQVADSVGTAEAVLSVVAEPPDAVEVARAGMSSVVTVDGRARAILAGSPSAGAAVSWWLAHETPGTDPDRLFAAARALADGPVGPVVLPYLAGRQAPAPDPSARMRVIGRRAEHTSAELARALLDGLSLQARWLVAEQHRLAGGRPESIVVLGGPLAANPAWLEIKARAMPVPMRVVTEAEAVAVGAGVVAAERAGLLTEAPVIPTDPAPAGPDLAYDQAFAAFVAAATEVRGDAA